MSQKSSVTKSAYSVPGALTSDNDVQASTNAGTLTNPTGAVTASSTASPYYTANDPTDSNKDMAANIVAGSSGDKPHTNLMPYLVMNFIIALQGFYPSRN